MSDPFEPWSAGNGDLGDDAWAQISSPVPQTPERQAREEQIAARVQLQVEQLIASGAPTRPLRHVRTLSPPFVDATLIEVGTQHDGTLGAWWSDLDGDRDLVTVESETGRVAQVKISSFPGRVDYIAAIPGRRWLGSAARSDWTRPDDTLADTAWVIDANGTILARGCLGDAHLRPVVMPGARIFVTYFDEHPLRGSDGTWMRNSDGGWAAVPNSIRPLASIDEYSPEGRYSAGYSGMTIFDDQLRVMGRHESPTDICEVYTFHPDGERFWYVSYPDWIIDCWGANGQEEPTASGEYKGVSLIASGGQIARFGGPGEDRDSLFMPAEDGRMLRQVITFPDGAALQRGTVTTWAHQLHYVDGLDWYILNVFHAA